MSTPYAQVSDLMARFDVRILGDVCEDSGSRVSSLNLPTDPNVLTALTDAAAAINLAAQIGERYTQADLASLSGVDQAILFRLNSDLAFTYLCQRRGVTPSNYKEAYERSTDMLTKLRNGELIFNVPGDVASGVAVTQFMTTAQWNQVNTLRSATRFFFPTRRIQHPQP